MKDTHHPRLRLGWSRVADCWTAGALHSAPWGHGVQVGARDRRTLAAGKWSFDCHLFVLFQLSFFCSHGSSQMQSSLPSITARILRDSAAPPALRQWRRGGEKMGRIFISRQVYPIAEATAGVQQHLVRYLDACLVGIGRSADPWGEGVKTPRNGRLPALTRRTAHKD